MASFMPCFKKIDLFIDVRRLWLGMIVLLLMALLSSAAFASNKGRITIESFNLQKTAEGYQIDVEADIVLNKTLKEALEKGVELYFVTRFSIIKPRWYWLDEEVARSKERVGLSYHALTRQYRLIHHNQLQNFATLEATLGALGKQFNSPVDEYSPLMPDTEYIATLQIWLDVSRLSKPFQLESFDTQDWNLSSEKKTWHVRLPLLSEINDEFAN